MSGIAKLSYYLIPANYPVIKYFMMRFYRLNVKTYDLSHEKGIFPDEPIKSMNQLDMRLKIATFAP